MHQVTSYAETYVAERALAPPQWGRVAPHPSRGLHKLRCLGTGTCLEPILVGDRQVVYYEPGARPIDGDMIVVRWTDAEVAEFHERTGRHSVALGAKLFKNLAGSDFIVSREGVYPLRKVELVGVVRCVVPVTPFAVSAVFVAEAHAAQLNTNAATVISQFSQSGLMGMGPWTGAIATQSSGTGLSMPAFSYDVSAIFTVTMMSKQTSGTGAYVTIGETSGGIPTTVSTILNLLTGTNTPYTMQCQFVIPANTAQNFAIMFGGGNAGSNQVTGDSLTVQVEYIKR
jgi:hypothetical protein